MSIPTANTPHYHLSAGGAGYIYAYDGAWILEHCTDGIWSGCPLGTGELWRAEQRAIGHLRRAAQTPRHRRPIQARLAGITHAPWPKP